MNAMAYAESSLVDPAYGLHPYQRQVLTDAVAALASRTRRTVIHMPTGAGKTRVACHAACHMLKQYGAEGKVVVWLAATEELCAQAADDLRLAWSHLGDRPIHVYEFWGDNDKPDLGRLESGFLVAGIQKLYAAARRDVRLLRNIADNVVGVIFDEAHQSVARTYEYVTKQLITYEAPLLGLTATPGRTADFDVDLDYRLTEMFGNSKVTIDPRGHGDPVTYLIRQEYLANPYFVSFQIDSGLSLHDSADVSDYSLATLNHIGDSEIWSKAITDVTADALESANRVLVFAPSVSSAKQCAAAVAREGVEARTVLAETGDEERRDAIARFRENSSERMALFNYGVLTAGFDAPKTRCVVIARPTKSLVLYSQMCGRAMRGPKSGGNRTCRIYTVIDMSLPGFGSVTEAFTNWEALWQSDKAQ